MEDFKQGGVYRICTPGMGEWGKKNYVVHLFDSQFKSSLQAEKGWAPLH